MTAAVDPPVKPLLRGVLHQVAAVAAVVVGAVFVASAPNARAAWGGFGFCASLFVLFAVSATYHRVHWENPTHRAWMRRADHASIFILIAGTYTPICVVGLPPALGDRLVVVVWAGALVGVLQSLLWVHAPKVVVAGLAVALGWAVVPYWTEARAALLDSELGLLVAGGVAYTIGAVCYALKRPALAPRVFGYHELFHALTLVAAGLHIAAVHSILQRS